MKTNKKRRKEYRAALRERNLYRQDRFSEMMEAVLNGGSQKCACCGLLRPVRALHESGVCQPCARTLGRVRTKLPRPRTPTLVTLAEPGVVYTDASYKDGLAGLAVVGALGEHFRKVEASSSTHAEVLAFRWALEIARAADVHALTFRTDCQAAFLLHQGTGKRLGWLVEQVPRSQNRIADQLASHARKRSDIK